MRDNSFVTDSLWKAYQSTHLNMELPDGSVQKLEQVDGLSGDEWPFDVTHAWIITAFNPRSSWLPLNENEKRHHRLGAELEEKGIEYLPNRGYDPTDPTWWEAGYTLPGADASIAVELARRWEQNAVFAWYPDKWSIVGVLLQGTREHGWKWIR